MYICTNINYWVLKFQKPGSRKTYERKYTTNSFEPFHSKQHKISLGSLILHYVCFKVSDIRSQPHSFYLD